MICSKSSCCKLLASHFSCISCRCTRNGKSFCRSQLCLTLNTSSWWMGPWKWLKIVVKLKLQHTRLKMYSSPSLSRSWCLTVVMLCYRNVFPAKHWRSRHEGLVAFSRPSHVSPVWFCAGISWVPGWVSLLLSVDTHWPVHTQIQTSLHQIQTNLLVWARKIQNLLNFGMQVF